MGHLKILNFPFVPNGKFIIFRCPKIWANYSLIIMCSNTGTPNNHHFLFGTNGKVVELGVPILKHFRVFLFHFKEHKVTGHNFRGSTFSFLASQQGPTLKGNSFMSFKNP